MYTPFHRDNWSMGGLLGDVTGYDPDNLKRPQWAAVPLVVYKQDGWLVNVPFVPPFRKQGIVAVQVGLKFYWKRQLKASSCLDGVCSPIGLHAGSISFSNGRTNRSALLMAMRVKKAKKIDVRVKA